MYIQSLVAVLSLNADTTAPSWKAALSAAEAAALYSNSRVMLLFRSGRTVTCYLRNTADGSNLVEIPHDGDASGPHEGQYKTDVWAYDALPAFIGAASTQAVVIEVYSVVMT